MEVREFGLVRAGRSGGQGQPGDGLSRGRRQRHPLLRDQRRQRAFRAQPGPLPHEVPHHARRDGRRDLRRAQRRLGRVLGPRRRPGDGQVDHFNGLGAALQRHVRQGQRQPQGRARDGRRARGPHHHDGGQGGRRRLWRALHLQADRPGPAPGHGLWLLPQPDARRREHGHVDAALQARRPPAGCRRGQRDRAGAGLWKVRPHPVQRRRAAGRSRTPT